MNNAQTNDFDLSTLDGEAGLAITQMRYQVVFREDADGNPLTGIWIVGKNSEEYQNENGKIRIENIMRAGKRSKQVDSSTEDGAKIIADTVAANEKRLALAVAVDWFGIKLEGAPATFNKQDLKRIFDKMPMWQAKANNALDTDANFTKV